MEHSRGCHEISLLVSVLGCAHGARRGHNPRKDPATKEGCHREQPLVGWQGPVSGYPLAPLAFRLACVGLSRCSLSLIPRARRPSLLVDGSVYAGLNVR